MDAKALFILHDTQTCDYRRVYSGAGEWGTESYNWRKETVKVLYSRTVSQDMIDRANDYIKTDMQERVNPRVAILTIGDMSA